MMGTTDTAGKALKAPSHVPWLAKNIDILGVYFQSVHNPIEHAKPNEFSSHGKEVEDVG